MSAIPRVAAEWMVSSLPSRNGRDYVVDQLVTNGLGILTVKELKLLAERVYSMVSVLEESSIKERRLPSSAKKQRRVDFLRRGLFRDDSCTIINDRLLQQMRSETAASTTTAAASSTTAANGATATTSATESRKRPNNQISQPNRPDPQQQQPQQRNPQQNRLSTDDMSLFFNAYLSQMSQLNRPAATQHRPNRNPAQNLWFDMPIPPAQPTFGASDGRPTGETTGASAAAGSSSTAPAAAPAAAPAVDPNSTPRTPTEAMLLPQLLQMGFPKQEILDGIRQCQSTNNNATTLTADEVMLHLVSQREEAEEARKEDEVRLASEDQKQEEIRRRERNQQESLSQATTKDDLTAIFSESWVVHTMSPESIFATLNSKGRDDFLEFLKLEEKSRKWYGWVLPAEYFRKVGKQLKTDADKEEKATTYLKKEREKLRSGLYELKEQLKGQPKIFLDEKPDEKIGQVEIVIIDDDD